MPNEFVGDFSKVKDRNFNIKHLPEGDYPAKITKIEDHKAKSGNANWLYTLSITKGPGKGASYPVYCGLDPDQLWKLRNLYAACGITIPKKKIKLRRDHLMGKELGITLEDDEYDDKMKSVISNFLPLSELDGDGPSTTEVADDDEEETEDVEETPAPKKKKDKAGKAAKEGKAKKSKPTDEGDELEEIEIEDL